MKSKATKSRSNLANLISVQEEMSQPRIVLSAEKLLEGNVNENAKFCTGDLVYKRVTNQHGKIRKTYEVKGMSVYEVTAPLSADATRSLRYRWQEDLLDPA